MEKISTSQLQDILFNGFNMTVYRNRVIETLWRHHKSWPNYTIIEIKSV